MEITTSSTVQPENMYNYMNSVLMNPVVFFIITIIFAMYIIFFSNLGKSDNSVINSNESNGSTSNFLYGFIIFVFICLIIINGVQYFFGVDVIASFKGLFSDHQNIDIKVVQNSDSNTNNNIPEIKILEEVFNIPGNYYNYNDADTLCKAYGSRLATYDEVENAYQKGGEWCNYGWSDGQMALFPTQKNTFNNLQNIKGHEHDCGRPGVNGGYIANPNVKFGVNCFGYKPKMTDEEEELMQVNSPYPKTEQDIAMEKRIDYWKRRLNEILVSPFNYNSWSKI